MIGVILLNSCNFSLMIFGEIICDNFCIFVVDLVLVNFNSFEIDDFVVFFVICYWFFLLLIIIFLKIYIFVFI